MLVTYIYKTLPINAPQYSLVTDSAKPLAYTMLTMNSKIKWHRGGGY